MGPQNAWLHDQGHREMEKRVGDAMDKRKPTGKRQSLCRKEGRSPAAFVPLETPIRLENPQCRELSSPCRSVGPSCGLCRTLQPEGDIINVSQDCKVHLISMSAGLRSLAQTASRALLRNTNAAGGSHTDPFAVAIAA